MQGQYSMRSPAVKRLMKEAQELSEPTEQYYAQPLDDNLFEWHFTIRGPSDSDFDGGIYHGRIILPPEYPMKPPSIILLTPNGRFETNKKICLSISGYHPESWQPSWSIRTALLAIIGFMPTHGAGAVGSLDYTKEERQKLAKKTLDWKCPTCGSINYILKAVTADSEKTRQEAEELASQINFQGEKEKKPNEDTANKKESDQPKESIQSTASQEAADSAQSSPQLPPPFGQMPFTRFPFPPPFMPMPGFPLTSQSNSTTGVPRFPPPPPFIPAMFPPGFMQNMASGQVGEGGQLFMPPWQMNPHMTNQSNRAASELRNTDKDNTNKNKVQGDSSENQNKRESTTSKSENKKSSESANTKDENHSPDNQTSADNQNSPSVTEPESSSPNFDQNTDRIINETAEDTLLRHRFINSDAPSHDTSAGRVGQSAELDNRHQRHSGITFSTVLIFLIGCAIALLLIRRFFLSRNWKFYYGY